MTRALLAVALFAGCVDIHPSAPFCDDAFEIEEPTETPTFHQDVRPILRRSCARCHRDDGIAGFSLDGYQEVAALADRVRAQVVSGEMPPWKPARCCAEYQHIGALSPAEIGTIAAWVDGGMIPGDAVEPPPIESGGLSRIDLEVQMPEPFLPVPPPGTLDQTRCFALDWPLDAEVAVTGLEIEPGNAGVVHHALVLVAAPSQVDRLRALDDADPGPGWDCPGGVVRDFTGYLGGWSPGFAGADFPADLGQRVEPGSALILTVHYSLHDLGQPDQSTVRLKLDSGPTRARKALAVFNPAWLAGAMPIPAGDPSVTHSYVFEPTLYNGGNPYTLYGVNLHMHERGSHGLVSILRADGSTECLLQIDDWEYEWQDDYLFAEPVRLERGDRLYVECNWDNSAANQRLVDGAPQTPRDLEWAEDEEMCVAFVTAAPE